MSDLANDWDYGWQNNPATLDEELANISESEHYPFILKEFQRLNVGGSVMDAGSGVGRWVFLAAQMGYQAYGIDLSQKGLAIAQQYALANQLPSHFFVGDLRAQPVAAGSFDCVISLGAIEHFPQTAQAVKEFQRILKAGGRCFITTPNTWSFHGTIGYKMLSLIKSRRLGYLGYENTFSPTALRRLMVDAGFAEVECGVMPTPFLFGVFYRAIPVIGERLQNFLEWLSLKIESRQSRIGFMSYAAGHKPA